MELGGNDAMIILADADLEKAAKAVVLGPAGARQRPDLLRRQAHLRRGARSTTASQIC